MAGVHSEELVVVVLLLLPTLLGHHDCAAPCLQQDVGGGRRLCWRHPIGAGASRQDRWSGAEGGRLIPQQ